MSLNLYFKLASYSVVFCGAVALLVTGGINLVVLCLFLTTVIVAWRLEDSKFQLSERFGLVIIVLSLPLFYFDWQFQTANSAQEQAGATALAHLIMGLSAIKLFQKKVDRDWIFLYLISFFEILLSAGLSVSPIFLAILVLYLLIAS